MFQFVFVPEGHNIGSNKERRCVRAVGAKYDSGRDDDRAARVRCLNYLDTTLIINFFRGVG
jgi:hypothetical protein